MMASTAHTSWSRPSGRELRTLTRFSVGAGGRDFCGRARGAVAVPRRPSHHRGAGADHPVRPSELKELRESVEALAMEIHAKVRSALDDVRCRSCTQSKAMRCLPSACATAFGRFVLTVKDAAKQLRSLGRPLRHPSAERKSERVRKSLHQDVWAFRFILRAFVAKASVASVGADYWSDVWKPSSSCAEFVRHFRVFGPRLTRGTDYARRGPLTRAVSALESRRGDRRRRRSTWRRTNAFSLLGTSMRRWQRGSSIPARALSTRIRRPPSSAATSLPPRTAPPRSAPRRAHLDLLDSGRAQAS